MAKRDKTLSDAELEDALEVLQGESDRACAVLGAAHLEYLLAKAILKAMPHGEELAQRLFYESNAPLGTFSARIDIAYAMGLIDADTRSDLGTIRILRNDFAHDLQTHSFHENDSIRDRCRNLKRGVAYAQRFGASGLTFFDDEVTEFFSPHAVGKSVMFLVALGHPDRAALGLKM